MFYLTSVSYHFYFSLDSSFDFFFPHSMFSSSLKKTQHTFWRYYDTMFVPPLFDYLHPHLGCSCDFKQYLHRAHSLRNYHFKRRSWADKYSVIVTTAKVHYDYCYSWSDHTSYFFYFIHCIEDSHAPCFRALNLDSFSFLPPDNILSQALLHITPKVPTSLTIVLKAILRSSVLSLLQSLHLYTGVFVCLFFFLGGGRAVVWRDRMGWCGIHWIGFLWSNYMSACIKRLKQNIKVLSDLSKDPMQSCKFMPLASYHKHTVKY